MNVGVHSRTERTFLHVDFEGVHVFIVKVLLVFLRQSAGRTEGDRGHARGGSLMIKQIELITKREIS